MSDRPIQIGSLLCHPRRILVKTGANIPLNRSRLGQARIIRDLPKIGWTIVEAPVGKLQESRRRIANQPGVLRATFDRAARPSYTPNDPMWGDQWSLPAIKVDLAWDASLGSNAPIVAVIDTGVQVDHPDLAPNIWVNADEIPGNLLDDDQNGYVDDVNGYDFAYNDSNPNDVYGHGTPCAGIVAAVGDNGIGLSGVAPKARIMAIKACVDEGFFYDSMTAPAYLYAADNGARVFSMSYFSDQVSPIEKDAMEYSWSQGVLPIAAAGNSSSIIPYYSGAYDRVMAVAAVNGSLNKAGFSNYGAWVDVAAGGTGLVATAVNSGYTTGFGGTSGATPHVAGLAALLLGANPLASNVQLREAIEDSATGVNQSPFGEYCNYGLVNAQAAMQAILGTPAPPRTPVARYVSLLGFQPNDVHYDSDGFLVARVYGRGFQAPRLVEATVPGKSLVVRRQTRDYIDIDLDPPMTNPMEIRVDGQLIASLTMPSAHRVAYPVSEISTPGGAATHGGFLQALSSDGQTVRCTRLNDGRVFVQATFHRLQNSHELIVRMRRRYSAIGAQSVETVRVYDWSSASYPYGTYVELSSVAPPTEDTTSQWTLPNPTRFFDDERTLYLVIETTDLPSGAELFIDEWNIQSPR